MYVSCVSGDVRVRRGNQPVGESAENQQYYTNMGTRSSHAQTYVVRRSSFVVRRSSFVVRRCCDPFFL